MSEKKGGFIFRFLIVILRAMIINSKYLYKHLRNRGCIVVVWVLNEEEEFEEALLFGEDIDGVMTDCPTKLKEYIKNRQFRKIE